MDLISTGAHSEPTSSSAHFEDWSWNSLRMASGRRSLHTHLRVDWNELCLHSETPPGGEGHVPSVSSSRPGEGRNVRISPELTSAARRRPSDSFSSQVGHAARQHEQRPELRIQLGHHSSRGMCEYASGRALSNQSQGP